MPVYDDSSDEQLMNAARDNDFGAWEAFLRRHGQRLLAFTSRMCGDAEDSRALWAQSFEEVWKQRNSLKREKKASTALFTIAVELCAKVPDTAAVRKPSSDPASMEARATRLSQALLSIPKQARGALCLCYFDNVSFVEAEHCLTLAPGEARRHCAQGYEILTKALGPGFLDEGLA